MTFDFSGRSLEDSMRVSQMRESWAAYSGAFASPLQNRPRKQNDAVIINRCRPVVDKAVSALTGHGGIEFQVADEENTGAQEYLDGCFRANKKTALLQKLFITGAVTGHLFIKIVPAFPYPRLIVLDPATVSVEHAPDDVDDIRSYTIAYQATDGEGQNTEYRQTIIHGGPVWTILDQQKTGRVWTTTATNVWAYPFSPIVDCQNLPNPNNFWGIADLTPDLIQINKQINLTYSNVNRILKYHAHPKTWVSGLNGNKLSVGPDETIVLPEGASIGALESHGDIANSLGYAKKLETAMDVLSRTPSLALGDLTDVPRGQVTGPALEVMLEPLIEKTSAKQALIGDMLSEVNRRVLILGGFEDDIEVFVRWPEIIPSDPVTTAQVAQTYLSMGVSKTTVFARLNLDFDQERESLEREAMNPPTPTADTLTNTTSESETKPDEVNDTVQLRA